MLKLKNPIILALDVDDQKTALHFTSEVGSLVGAIKIGPRLVNKYGAALVKELSQVAPIFVDNKYFDIPSTMVSAVRQIFEAGSTMTTVHALAGKEALQQLAKLEKELNQIRPFKILAVTILTSWDQESFPQNMQPWSVKQHVRTLSEHVVQAGLSGLVCSAHELVDVKDLNLFKVTPGIRLEKSDDDQKRTMTPKEAVTAGASALVIGRPILQAPNPKDFTNKILDSFL